ncbi:MAG: YkgJ family cysteine cluster protein [Methylococcaceae bacterium]|nr:MAG: YkgJ family cysteine cluster protein [Methylococcaceae bacterium]
MSEFQRRPQHRYQDPLARIWIDCAERGGFRIARTATAYASSDGRGTIFIGSDETLDPDDSLAQMILHELCHALVQGEENESKPDWGLSNEGRIANPWREHACLRLQAFLADSVGLRDFFAPTTDYRVSFWDSLPPDPFAADGGRRDSSCVAARAALWRASLPRWAGPLQTALQASAAIAAVVPRQTQDEAQSGLPSLWTTAAPMPPRHPAGHAAVAAYHAGHGCSDCAWNYKLRETQRCRHAPKIRLDDAAPACTRWEAAAELDCLDCGACCREAFDAVEISAREPLIQRHPTLLVIESRRRKLRRHEERCAALTGGTAPGTAYACAIYADRPRTCREFARAGGHCLEARRRVGLSL